MSQMLHKIYIRLKYELVKKPQFFWIDKVMEMLRQKLNTGRLFVWFSQERFQKLYWGITMPNEKYLLVCIILKSLKVISIPFFAILLNMISDLVELRLEFLGQDTNWAILKNSNTLNMIFSVSLFESPHS